MKKVLLLVVSLFFMSCVHRLPCPAFDINSIGVDTCFFKRDLVYVAEQGDSLMFKLIWFDFEQNDSSLDSYMASIPCRNGVYYYYSKGDDRFSYSLIGIKNLYSLNITVNYCDVDISYSSIRDTVISVNTFNCGDFVTKSWVKEIRVKNGLITEILDTLNETWRLTEGGETFCDSFFLKGVIELR